MDEDEDGYILRIYKTKGDDYDKLYSPFAYTADYHTPGKVSKAGDAIRGNKNSGYLLSAKNDVDSIVFDKGDIPHTGFSTFGVRDPEYSIVDAGREEFDKANHFFIGKDGAPVFDVSQLDKYPNAEQMKAEMKDCLNHFPGLGDKVFAGEGLTKSEVNKVMSLLPYNTTALYHDATSAERSYNDMMSKKFGKDRLGTPVIQMQYNPGAKLHNPGSSERPYDSVLDNIDWLRTLPETDTDEKLSLWLAKAPKSAFYKTQDAFKHSFDTWRDFPEELVVNQITPLQGIDLNKFMNEYYDMQDKLQHNYIKNDFTDIDKSAGDLISKYFKTNPENIVSDKLMKNIYKDMSKSLDRQLSKKSILKALKGVL